MRREKLVCYDICDDKRLRLVFRIMKGFGEHIQYSVFRCSLTKAEKYRMMRKLAEVINFLEDQVLIVDLGKTESFKSKRFEAVGRPFRSIERGPQVF